jgi:transposase
MVRDRQRAEIILLRLEGVSVAEIAVRLETTAKRVSMWSKRFETRGLAGLEEAAGRGRKPSISAKKIDRIVTEVTRPPKGCTRWSVRSMGRHAGVSHSTVQRIWSKNDLKPHVTRTFKLSNDTDFEKKFWDVIGLYLDPPANALVLCCDEKSQCQALERSQPGLPLGPGHPRTMTHDYRRHGTTTLFAALDYLEGKLITRTEQRHTHVEWLRFLKQIDRETPKGLELHLIADNYATHKHPKVKSWRQRRSRARAHAMSKRRLPLVAISLCSWVRTLEKHMASYCRVGCPSELSASANHSVRRDDLRRSNSCREPKRSVSCLKAKLRRWCNISWLFRLVRCQARSPAHAAHPLGLRRQVLEMSM